MYAPFPACYGLGHGMFPAPGALLPPKHSLTQPCQWIPVETPPTSTDTGSHGRIPPISRPLLSTDTGSQGRIPPISTDTGFRGSLLLSAAPDSALTLDPTGESLQSAPTLDPSGESSTSHSPPPHIHNDTGL
ncbi:hypothetical protein KIL84_021058 [Mauremys mutica]|uniref:Uncharacterized protein n=1 Tax=Mauremys mutica TaxID=74926 RepID=A0A9D4B0H6_9SAUR|nr:hypothetical protein KIL84_021058 [Mauremys mutica]